MRLKSILGEHIKKRNSHSTRIPIDKHVCCQIFTFHLKITFVTPRRNYIILIIKKMKKNTKILFYRQICVL